MVTIEKHGIILSPIKNGFENYGVLNPGIYQEDNKVHIFYRAVEDGNYSTIGYAKTDGPIKFNRITKQNIDKDDRHRTNKKNCTYDFRG